MKKSDKALIAANPDKTPYELLQLGLSPEGLEELEKERTAPHYAAKLKPAAPQPIPTTKHIAKPTLSQYNGGNIGISTQATLVNIKTGKKKPMEKTAAERMARKYPNEFRVTY